MEGEASTEEFPLSHWPVGGSVGEHSDLMDAGGPSPPRVAPFSGQVVLGSIQEGYLSMGQSQPCSIPPGYLLGGPALSYKLSPPKLFSVRVLIPAAVRKHQETQSKHPASHGQSVRRASL